jgi:hypothetical protein
MGADVSAAVVIRFWAKVDKRGPDDCWPWTGARRRRGYGVISVGAGSNRKMVVASRLSWEMANGAIPPGMMICHKCDNPPCVNPGHLFLGTGADNARDTVRKGRNYLKSLTHCLRGHEFSPENTRTDNRGSRICRTCVIERCREWRAKQGFAAHFIGWSAQ